MASARKRRASGVCRCRFRWMAVTILLCLVSVVFGMRDPYQVLGVSRRASKDEIKKCYRKLCLLYHPDKNVGKTQGEQLVSEAKFKQVREAYDAILNKNHGLPTNAFGGTPTTSLEVWFAALRTLIFQPGLVLREMKKINLFAMGSPICTRGNPTDPNIMSKYYQVVYVPLEDLYKGVPVFDILLEDSLWLRYKASIRGGYILFSLYQASIFAMALFPTSRILGWAMGLYILHGTTPIPDPKAKYRTTIPKGTQKKAVRFAKWRQLEIFFQIQEAEHPIYSRKGSNLHAQITLTTKEAKNGCTKILPALDPAEEAIEIIIPPEKFNYEREREWLEKQKENEKQQPNRQSNITASFIADVQSFFARVNPFVYHNTIHVKGRGWPIKRKKSQSDPSDFYTYGNLIVEIKVQKKKNPKGDGERETKTKRGINIFSFLSRN